MASKSSILSKWERRSCINYKKGSVLIVENDNDINEFDKCYKPIDISKIKENIIYQYIVSENEIKMMPAMKKNEIGSKHDCLIRHFKDNEVILASGELIKNKNEITYSCISSLFMTLMGILWKEEKIKVSERENYKQTYEKNVSKFLKEYLKEYTIKYIKYIESGKLQKFNPENLCKSKNTPKCLRYMKKGDCRNQANNPKGPDCNSGVDFCSNLNIESLTDINISESEYIYQERFDMEKIKEYYSTRGKTNLNPRALKLYISQDKLNDEEFTIKELIWPILEI